MSEGGRVGRKPSANKNPIPEPQPEEQSVPRTLSASQLLGEGRLDGVRAECESAAAQIGRTLSAWRKANGSGARPAKISQSGGSPLPGDVRSKMEGQLGSDLSAVRVHADGASAETASSLGARAFTVGEAVHFNHGEFSPGTKEGDRLLAHELTHVVQGQKSGIQRRATMEAPQPAKEWPKKYRSRVILPKRKRMRRVIRSQTICTAMTRARRSRPARMARKPKRTVPKMMRKDQVAKRVKVVP